MNGVPVHLNKSSLTDQTLVKAHPTMRLVQRTTVEMVPKDEDEDENEEGDGAPTFQRPKQKKQQ